MSVAKGLKICGADGASQCTKADVTIISVTRRRRASAKIKFQVATQTKAAADSGAAKVKAFLEDKSATGFVQTLLKIDKAKGAGGALQSVTGVSGVATASKSSTVPTPSPAVASVGKTATFSAAALALAGVAM